MGLDAIDHNFSGPLSSPRELANDLRLALSQKRQNQKHPKMSTVLAHAGTSCPHDDSNCNNTPSPPLPLANNYQHNDPTGRIYARSENPTRRALEKELGCIEQMGRVGSSACNGKRSIAFASGISAVSALLLAHPKSHILLSASGKNWLTALLKSQGGITWETVDTTSVDAVREVMRGYFCQERKSSLILWLETPSNPCMEITDIQALSVLARTMEENITIVVDSTSAPPPITQPLILGADISLHLGSNYLSGYSDAVLGLLTISPFNLHGQRLHTKLLDIRCMHGSAGHPFDCWLTLLGMRTLHLRLERQSNSALLLANFLLGKKGQIVKVVHYPGLTSHPHHAIVQNQMSCGGGMLSFEVSDEFVALAVTGAVRLFKHGTTLGGTESTMEHLRSAEPEGGKASPEGLLRLSVGLENVQDLIEDMNISLELAHTLRCQRKD